MRSPCGINPGWSLVSAASRQNRQDINHLLAGSTIEENAPLANAESPEALWPAKALDVTLGKPANR